jgi:uncharacterized protein YndB with AHSA1/START domain
MGLERWRRLFSQRLDALATELARGRRARRIGHDTRTKDRLMIDIANQLKAIHREVGQQTAESGEVVTVLMKRSYDADIEDLWDALTDPVRLKRWFLPITGDLKVGGTFQLEGNAGGEILECEPPRRLKVTFGGPTSIVELRLSDEGDLELEHTVPIEMAGSVAGALFVGPGWDGMFLALDLFLRGEVSDDPVAAANSPEGLEFTRQSVYVWLAVVEEAGTASAEQIEQAKAMSLAQFAPGES